jgi:predicted transcriptional regulator
MPRMIGTGLSRREREIVDVLNRLGCATVAEIEQTMPDPPSNSAVRSILRVLREKGHIRHEERGKRYVYLPSVPRVETAQSALANVIQTFFNGSITSAVNAFLSNGDVELSDDELAQLAQMVESAKNNGADGSRGS